MNSGVGAAKPDFGVSKEVITASFVTTGRQAVTGRMAVDRFAEAWFALLYVVAVGAFAAAQRLS